MSAIRRCALIFLLLVVAASFGLGRRAHTQTSGSVEMQASADVPSLINLEMARCPAKEPTVGVLTRYATEMGSFTAFGESGLLPTEVSASLRQGSDDVGVFGSQTSITIRHDEARKVAVYPIVPLQGMQAVMVRMPVWRAETTRRSSTTYLYSVTSPSWEIVRPAAIGVEEQFVCLYFHGPP